MPTLPAHDRFLTLLRTAVQDGTLTKLTLGKHRGGDPTLQNLFVRPVTLNAGPRLAFVWRHTTKDVTKNHPLAEALTEIESLLGHHFLDAHLFSRRLNAQFESNQAGTAKLRIIEHAASPDALPSVPPGAHDRAKSRPIAPTAPWLRALGVTNDRGQPREGMADKFRQIQKFAELLSHLLEEAFPSRAATASQPSIAPDPPRPLLQIADMGSGKGYLTFALADLLGSRAVVHGLEARSELVELCNRVARENGFAPGLSFTTGTIADAPLDACDVLIALHACDTATDDALARGIAAGATLLVAAPCCQKELRPQLTAPPVLADALRHGIFQERQAEFVTDSLRAQLLEWAGYRTRVFEFISTEHTAKNLMIAGIKTRPAATAADAGAKRIREFAAFYGITRQSLASALGFELLTAAE